MTNKQIKDDSDEYFKEFQEDINKVWIKKLDEEFYIQNNIIDQHLRKTLDTPNFAFSFRKRQYGEWDSKNKKLTISYHLINNYEWDAVVHTLKHEMAHMIASEIWGDIDDNGRSHGELFKKACNILGIDGRASHSHKEKSEFRLSEKEKVTAKIHKLFNLGESNHEAEAELAIQKAHELMAKYNVSMVDRPKEKRIFVSRPTGHIWGKVPEYVKDAARIVSEHYFVKYIFITYKHSYGQGPGTKRYVEFYGEPHNVDIAEYIFHFLLVEGHAQWKKFKKTDKYKNRHDEDDYVWSYSQKTGKSYKRKKMTYSKTSFLEGLYSGFSSTLYKNNEKIMKKVDPSNTLPIGTRDALLDEKYNSRYNPVNWNSGGRGCSGMGYGEGSSVGKGIKVRQGVSRGSGSKRKLICA